MLSLVDAVTFVDRELTRIILSTPFTENLLATSTSKLISEVLLLSFILLLGYEIFYWLGIYVGLWEYHAKDIFTEIPIHCAHVYIRLNVAPTGAVDRVREYYRLRQNRYNLLSWTTSNQIGTQVFEFEQFVKYHFEFSPEDFEMNDEPEYGSTVRHLRDKILSVVDQSHLYRDYHLKTQRVIVFDNRNHEVPFEKDGEYLSKTHIETGNVIDCILLVE